MNLHFDIRRNYSLLLLASAALIPALAHADQQQMLGDASKAALEFVAPSIVQIQTIGGQEKVGGFIVGSGPTTGLIVDEGGYIISSAFNFKHNPTTILVSLPSGKNIPAEIVARDKSRMLVLLRVETDEELTVPKSVPRADVKTGQFALAMGRTYDSKLPSVSVGIISATNRIWGKAIQTDAKVSPANYGGPLTDIRGRVIGVLVPLSAQNSSEVAGAEFYDGGIGFAIPMEDIRRMLPDLIAGKDIMPGKMGITIKGSDLYAVGPPEIAFCPVRSPAAKAGFKKGDRIIRVDDIKIRSHAQLRHAIEPRIAGETITLAVARGKTDIEFEAEIELTDKVDPYILPALGILPKHDFAVFADDDSADDLDDQDDVEAENETQDETEDADTNATDDVSEFALRVGYVYEDSPAFEAGLKVGDELITIDGESPTSVDDWRQRIALYEPGTTVKLGYRRDKGELQSIEVALRESSTEIPIKLPSRDTPGDETEKVEAEYAEYKLPEEPNRCHALIPSNYDPAVPCGVVVWLQPPGEFDQEEFEKRFRSLVISHYLIVISPQPQNKQRWQRAESAIVRKLFDKLANKYTVDGNRVIVHGTGVGASLGYSFAFENRDVVRGVAPVNAVIPLGVQIRGNDPFDRLEFYAFGCKKTRIFERMKSNIEALEKIKFPVISQWVEGEPRYLNNDELAEFGRWTETLERL